MSEREFTVIEDEGGVFSVVLIEVTSGPLNSGTPVFITEDEEEAMECAESLTSGEDPIGWMAIMAAKSLEWWYAGE